MTYGVVSTRASSAPSSVRYNSDRRGRRADVFFILVALSC